MPSQTTNYALKTYDRTVDTGVNFIDFRDNLAGTGASNMKIIDDTLKANADAITNLGGTGRTTETIKANADNILALQKQGFIYVNTTMSTANTYVANSITGITSYYTDLRIIVVVPTTNTASSTININGLGAISLSKIDKIGNANTLESGDLPANRLTAFRYNGSVFIALDLGSADQMNFTDSTYSSKNVKDAFLEAGSEILESTGSGVISGLTVSAQSTPNMTVNVATGIVHMTNGARFAPVANTALAISASDTVKPRTDIVYVNSSGIITYLAGALGTAAVAGSETYTITTNAVATDTVVMNGVTFTAIASGATGNQFNVGADTTTTATNLTTTLNANTTINALYTATSSTNIITLTEKVAGGGNTPTVSTKTGTIVITNGAIVTSASANSTAPSTPTDGFLLSQVAVAKNVTTIVTANITDKRVMKISLPTHISNNAKHRISVMDYGATGDGVTDDTQAFKDALSAVAPYRGSVFVPPTATGYLIAGQEIFIPSGVTLCGVTGRFKGYWTPKQGGSTLLITGNPTKESLATTYSGAVFVLDEGAAIKDLSFYYPNQTLTNPPVAYPFLIKGIGYRDTTVKNIYVHNVYQFADFSSAHERLLVENVYFDAYKTGIIVDDSFDVDRLLNIHSWCFSLQDYAVTSTQITAINTYKYANFTAIKIKRADSIQLSNIFLWGGKYGLVLGEAGKGCYGQATNVSLDGVAIGIFTQTLGGQVFTITNLAYGTGQDVKTLYGVTSLVVVKANHNQGSLDLVNVSSWGGADSFLAVDSSFGTVTTVGAKSRLVITNARVLDNNGPEFIYNQGIGGEVILRDFTAVDITKVLATTPIAGTTITFENPNGTGIAFNGVAQTIKRYAKNMQMGSDSLAVTTAGTQVQKTITFPVAFLNVPNIFTSITNSPSGIAGYVNVVANGVTTTGFTTFVNSFAAETVSFNWLAIEP